MKVIIAGSRGIRDIRIVRYAVATSEFEITTVISGRAKGVDQLGEIWARENHVLVDPHPADWTRYGCAAGHIRNCDMAKIGDALIAVWDGQSSGTASMINYMKLLAKPCYVLKVPGLLYNFKLHALPGEEAPKPKGLGLRRGPMPKAIINVRRDVEGTLPQGIEDVRSWLNNINRETKEPT